MFASQQVWKVRFAEEAGWHAGSSATRPRARPGGCWQAVGTVTAITRARWIGPRTCCASYARALVRGTGCSASVALRANAAGMGFMWIRPGGLPNGFIGQGGRAAAPRRGAAPDDATGVTPAMRSYPPSSSAHCRPECPMVRFTWDRYAGLHSKVGRERVHQWVCVPVADRGETGVRGTGGAAKALYGKLDAIAWHKRSRPQ